MGQTPTTAFPVCGTSNFVQTSVNLCGNKSVTCPCNTGGSIGDINPYYYRFTCFTSGTLGFVITPNNLGDDYDWQLFDITGKDPNLIYSDASLFVACDWSGTVGLTGAATQGTSIIECPSDTGVGPGSPNYQDPFSSMPSILKGHTYLLLISHFTNTQSGYTLSFGGNPNLGGGRGVSSYGSDVGTAVITDTTTPALTQAIVADCGSTTIKIGLSKEMQCSSLDANGSDFTLIPLAGQTPPSVIGATGDNCNSGFDMDSVTVTFSGPISPGNYLIAIKNGNDGNTLLDDCSTPIRVGDSATITIPTPPPPAPFDSIAPVGCAPSVLTVVFDKNIQCSSVDADGSEFRLTGPSGVIVIGSGCGTLPPGSNTSPTNIVKVQLSGPIVKGGTYQLQLVTGNDGNTLIDACSQQLTAGQTVSFQAGDTISAQIGYQVHLGCKSDTIDYSDPGEGGITLWNWTFDTTQQASGEQQQVVYTIFGQKTAKLVVSNGFCTDSSTVTVDLDNTLKAVFEATNLLCPNDKAYFSDSSIGSIIAYHWDFGDGTTSTLQYPPPKQYPDLPEDKNYLVQLIVSSSPSCSDTATQVIRAVANCFIAVPSAFTPNGDGINDYLYPLNAYKAVNLDFKVFNRWGQLVFETTNWTIRWDGTVNGQIQPVGTYVWTLRYTNSETGQKVVQQGTSVLIR